jgi:hypothetical protein
MVRWGVEMRVPVDAFIVSWDDILAAPNAAPAAASGRGALLLHVTAEAGMCRCVSWTPASVRFRNSVRSSGRDRGWSGPATRAQ